MYLYLWISIPKKFFGSETLFGVIIVVVGRVFCQDDCGMRHSYHDSGFWFESYVADFHFVARNCYVTGGV